MAEKIVSPGVFTNEVDQSYLPSRIAAIGAAVVGPTQKGPAGIPTTVSSYSEFLQVFGGAFNSGSGASEQSYKYLTNYAAQEYLKYADTLTVVRVLAGAYTPAQSTVSSSGGTQEFANASVTFASTMLPFAGVFSSAPFEAIRIDGANGELIAMITSQSSAGYNPANNNLFFTGSTLLGIVDGINNNSELNSVISASFSGLVLSITSSIAGTAGNGIKIFTGSISNVVYATDGNSGSLQATLSGGTDQATTAFVLTTLSDGADLNSTSVEGTNNKLASGSANNIRWEVTSRNETKGTFNLILRRGDDTSNRKTILEQYNNLTLDPNSTNYIGRVIGTQFYDMQDSGTTDPFLQLTGDFPNRSKYVRVSNIKNTINYLDANGAVRDSSLSYLLPAVGSGSFGGGSNGTVVHPIQFNENISSANSQGFNLGSGQVGATCVVIYPYSG
jgi:hypothetical protein